MVNCFRPLSGSYISQLYYSINESLAKTVSVPYRGATFLNLLLDSLWILTSTSFRPLSGSYISQSSDGTSPHTAVPSFPSPIGELHFSMGHISDRDGVHSGFPSPIGELHFSIGKKLHLTYLLIPVSVPYRGATFLNQVYLY